MNQKVHHINRHVFNKSAQIIAFADDVDIVARSKAASIEVFAALEKSAKKMGQKINQEKTTFMLVTPKNRGRKAPALHLQRLENICSNK